MKKFITQSVGLAFIFALIMGHSINVEAKEKVDKTIEVDPNSLVEVKHVSGRVKIVGWDKNKVQVSGELGERTENFIFERDGKSVSIIVEVKRGRTSWNWNDGEDSADELTIYLPRDSVVDYHSPNADLFIEDVYGGSYIDMINGDLKAHNLQKRLRLKTVNGDIKATELQGDLTLDSVNGDIKAQHTSGEEIRVNAVNGDIDVSSNASEVKAETVNGDIELELQDVADLQTNTVNGSIEIEMNLLDGGKVNASSVGGSIELGFQKSLQAKLSIEAHTGGSIVNRLSDDEASRAKYGPRRWLEFSLGQANSWVDVSTVHGRIELEYRD